ncbi:MAG: AhpC/TSA family protein [Oligoflexia bacterium]|nr:AhpC/TSA family protein [Oligoflexia bacterium]
MKLIYLVFSLFITHNFFAHATLQEKLDAKSSAGKAPKEATKVMNNALEKLRKEKISERSKKTGEIFPDFELKNSENKTIKLSEILNGSKAIITFYRGAWCPYCNIQLIEYNKHIELWKKSGAKLLAISPEKIELSKNFKEKNEFKFDLLFDENNKLAEKVGLVFGLPNDLKDLYKKFGIDLNKSQGNESWRLPISATYVVNEERKILYSFIDPDYKKRAEPEEITNALNK